MKNNDCLGYIFVVILCLLLKTIEEKVELDFHLPCFNGEFSWNNLTGNGSMTIKIEKNYCSIGSDNVCERSCIMQCLSYESHLFRYGGNSSQSVRFLLKG